MFPVSFPGNALFFYKTLKDISNIELLPSEDINEAMYDMSSENDPDQELPM